MIKKSTITSNQLALMAAGSALMFPYTFLPILRTPPANQDAWIVLLMAIAYILILNVPILFLANRFRGLDIVEMNEIIMGKIGGKITASVFMIFALFCFIGCMLITVLYVKTYLLVETPEWVILTFILVPLTYASIKGAGTIARLALIIVPMIILTIIFFFALAIEDMHLNEIFPILSDSTFLELNLGAFYTASRFSEVLIILLFSFYLRKDDSVNKTYFKGLLLFGSSFFLITTATLLVLGSDLAKLYNNPFLTVTRQAGGEQMFQRVQAINILAWFTGTIVKLLIYNYMASYIFSRIVNKKPQKYYVIPISIIGFIACLLPFMKRTSTVHALNNDKVFPFVVFAVIFVLGTILAIAYLLNMKNIDERIKQRLDEEEQKVLEKQAKDEKEFQQQEDHIKEKKNLLQQQKQKAQENKNNQTPKNAGKNIN